MMKTFSEQLLVARKASGLTQEQLAEQMNVSRPMISHWETGRTMPDLDTIKRLSLLLNHNFMQDEAPEPLAEEKASASQEDKEPLKKRKWGYLYSFLGGVAVGLVVMYLIMLPQRPQENPDLGSAPPQSGTSTPSPQTSSSGKLVGTLAVDNNVPPLVEINTIEWYRQPNERIEGQAYLAISMDENPLHAVPWDEAESGFGWHMLCDIQEENGIDFTVTEYSCAFFFNGTGAYIYRYDGDRVASWWGSNVIPALGKRDMPSSFPVDERDRIGVGLIFEGVDAGGHEREFHYYVELAREIDE